MVRWRIHNGIALALALLVVTASACVSKAAYQELQSQQAQTQQQLEAQQTEVGRLTSALSQEQARANDLSSQISTLKAELSAAQTKASGLETALATALKTSASLETELAKTQRTVSNLQSRSSLLDSIYSSLKADYSLLQSRFEGLQKINTQLSADKTQLSADKIRLTVELSSANQTISSLSKLTPPFNYYPQNRSEYSIGGFIPEPGTYNLTDSYILIRFPKAKYNFTYARIMGTGSMQPFMGANAQLFGTKSFTPTDIAVGDIVNWVNPTIGAGVTHQVIKVLPGGVITKGFNNLVDDGLIPWAWIKILWLGVIF